MESNGSSSYSPSARQDQTMTLSSPRSALMVAATGLGKTVMMAGLAARWPVGRVMLISHRFEINDQSRQVLQEWCGEDVDFEQASYWADATNTDNHCRVVVASVQTLNSKMPRSLAGWSGKRRLERFAPNEFGLLLIDEAHHAVARTYRRVVDHFSQNDDLRIVGVTATPDRLDKIGLCHVFDELATDYNTRWAVEQGWLVPVRQKFCAIEQLDWDIPQKKNKYGERDFTDAGLAQVLEQEAPLHEMATPILEATSDGQSAIIYLSSVKGAHLMADILNRHRQGCAVSIDGSMPPLSPRRQELTKRLREGDIQIMCNVGVATEGFDNPLVSVIGNARPTKSRAMYAQIAGRGLRPLRGTVEGLPSAQARQEAILASQKPSCLLIDFVGQAGRHDLVCTGDLLAGEESPEAVQAAAAAVRRGEYDGDMVEALVEEQKKLDERERRRREHIRAKSTYEMKDIDPWTPGKMVPPRSIPGFGGDREMTPKMRSALLKFGFSTPEVDAMNFAQAKSVLGKCFERVEKGLCSLKQRRLLEKFGISAAGMTFDEASAAITQLKNNGWRR